METYQKISEREHPLLRPGMYIGSVEPEEMEMHVIDPEGNLIYKKVCISPGLLKVFDELLVNAADHRVRTAACTENHCTTIRVAFDEGCVRVWNDGPGIDIRKHMEIDKWIPEMIFGDLRTGNNFSDTEKRVTGGLNGLGAKLCNIFSTKFRLTTVDSSRQLSYTQEWTNNMSEVTKPVIRKKTTKSFTEIEFWPDLSRFGGVDHLDEDILSVFRKRVYDISVTGGPTTKTYLNGKLIKCNTPERFVKMYVPEAKPLYFECGERWKVGAAFTPNAGFRAVSFVNSIATYKAGTHVEHVLQPIVRHIQDEVEAKLKKQYRPSPGQVREHLFLFVNCLIENPAFDSQQKEELKTKSKDFGSTCKIDKDFLVRVVKNTGIVKHIQDILTGKAKAELLKSSDGRKTSRISGIPKLVDAEWAGTARSMSCVLILTEGDSAKTTAIAALSDLPATEKNRFGVYPLRGKVKNVCETPPSKLNDNQEIADIKKILGLQQGKAYEDLSELRYGKVMFMTDQDEDGSHIKGLLMNLFYVFWPNLLKKDFISSLSTPIIRVYPKRGSGSGLEFYTQNDYETWKQTVDISLYRVKYFKGLGTSNRQESREYLKGLDQKIIIYHDEDHRADDAMKMAFEPKQADERKKWLLDYNPSSVLSTLVKRVSVAEFVDLELKHFSMGGLRRSIPDLIDGLTPSRRKVLYTAIKKGLWNQNHEVRVSQLAGAVSELACYHHGEASLQQTIVRLAQNYVGSNNLNLLYPSGQFGTRLEGGNDSASARYIMTYLCDIVKYIFLPCDEGILQHVQDDGTVVEPERFLPVIPMILVNGGEGIGTGWSSFVPPHNPVDIIQNLRNRLHDPASSFQPMLPWFRGFRGEVQMNVSPDSGKRSCSVRGIWEVTSPTTLRITELPVGTWTSTFKQKVINPLLESKTLDKITEDLSDVHVDMTLHFHSKDTLSSMLKDGNMEKDLKLVSSFSMENMHLFPPHVDHVKKYSSSVDILEDFYQYRITKYEERRLHLLKVKAYQRDLLAHKVRFINDVLSERLLLSKRTKQQVLEDAQQMGYQPFGAYADDPVKTYRYLEMDVFQLTTDKRSALEAELQKRQAEFEELNKKLPQELWLEDLDTLSDRLKTISDV